MSQHGASAGRYDISRSQSLSGESYDSICNWPRHFTLDASSFGGSIDLANASVGGNVTVSVGLLKVTLALV